MQREDVEWKRVLRDAIDRVRVQRGPVPRIAALALCVALAAGIGVSVCLGIEESEPILRVGNGAANGSDVGEAIKGDDDNDGEADAMVSDSPIVVDIDGAVASPGVYELAAGARLSDAIAAAGGLLPDADTARVNRAAPISDGQKLVVPRVGEESVGGAGSMEAEADGSGGQGGEHGQGELVNINTADVATLDGLPGVGPATAQAIIDDRSENGRFRSIEDLMRVSGIGEKKFEKLKGRICV